MNSENFLQLIANPNSVSKEQTTELAVILDEFPYFQMARVLHLKGLKNQHSFKYNNALKTTAAYTTNRTVLFDFITKDTLDYNKVSANEQAILNDIDVIDSSIIDHLYKSINASETEIKNKVKEIKKVLKKDDDVLEIGKPLNFSKNDAFSFNEWLQLNPKLPVKKSKSATNDVDAVQKTNKKDLIQRFIENKPKIKPVKNQEVSEVLSQTLLNDTSIMTETLARVYLEQKKYKKAIAAFKILSLKYPEKSSFFADQIKAIKFLEKQ